MGLAAVIFPGQGSQVVGMGKDVADSSSAARTVFERANEIVGFDLAKLCFEGPAEKLGRTDIQQPAIFVTSIAIWEAFVESGSSLGQFHRGGGLSLGEYSALCVSGAVAFDDALKLVCRRGQLMQEATLAARSGLGSLIGVVGWAHGHAPSVGSCLASNDSLVSQVSCHIESSPVASGSIQTPPLSVMSRSQCRHWVR